MSLSIIEIKAVPQYSLIAPSLDGAQVLIQNLFGDLLNYVCAAAGSEQAALELVYHKCRDSKVRILLTVRCVDNNVLTSADKLASRIAKALANANYAATVLVDAEFRTMVQELRATISGTLVASDATDDAHKWWYCYKTIDIDFQYSKITGTLFQKPQYSGASTTTKIEICGYKEENHYYETVIKDVSINGQSNPVVNFEVDVTGRKYIRIIFKGDYAVGSEDNPYEYAYVSELYLWK